MRSLLSRAAEACAAGLASGDEPFFKKLEWWLADGAFNHEPYGMFRTDSPYVPGDARTVEEFLRQETSHRWDGMQTLHDLFCQHVSEMLEQWVLQWLTSHAKGPLPSKDQWERVWSHEWEDALFMVNLNPRLEGSAWDEFLELPLSTLIEGWRPHANRVAAARALRAARMVSRQGLEAAMIEKIADELAHQRRENPTQAVSESLEALAKEGSQLRSLELAVYVHSTAFTRRLASEQVSAIHKRFPLPVSWSQPEAKEEQLGLIG